MREVATLNVLAQDSFGGGDAPRGDDTVVMDAADAVLALDLPPTARRAPAPVTRITTTAPRRRQSTTTPGPIPVVRPSRQSPPPSSLNLHVDKVIEYLDTFRFTLSQDENIKPLLNDNQSVIMVGAGKPKKHTTSRRPPTPSGSKIFRPVRSAEPKSSLRSVLSDSTNDDVLLKRSNSSKRDIFRTTTLPTNPSTHQPTIAMANSVHSQRNTPVYADQQRTRSSPDFSFLNDNEGDMESCVTNMIASMRMEHDNNKATGNSSSAFDWASLDKIQDQVEGLLREVRMEREATNEWVKAVRTSVDKWVNEQRLLIDCERKQAMERAATTKVRREKTGPVPFKEGKLQVIIHKQAQQIEELESRLAQTTLQKKKSPTATSALETPRYSQTIPAVGSQDSFFASIEQQESPTLPHLPQKQVHAKREYATTKDGRRLITFRNGTEREYLSDGTIITRYRNGDVKTEGADNSVIYWHHDEETKQTIHPDGMQVYEYPNRQIERHYPDGRKEVDFPHGVRRKIRADGTKESQCSLC
jgi:hypothetical protein